VAAAYRVDGAVEDALRVPLVDAPPGVVHEQWASGAPIEARGDRHFGGASEHGDTGAAAFARVKHRIGNQPS
jgi:hypothetical protein